MSRERLPPVMERTLTDDLKWAFWVLAGVVIGSLIVALNVVRWLRRRNDDESDPRDAGPTQP